MQALGTGGLFGKGWLNGPLTNNADIPVLWADFPFAAVGEQFGLVGCAVLLGLFGIALVRIWRIAHLSRDRFGTYVCAGVFTMLVWQIVQNVGMTMKLLPVTGLPLPFISYGGSGPDRVVRHVRPRPERPHATDALSSASPLDWTGCADRGSCVDRQSPIDQRRRLARASHARIASPLRSAVSTGSI